MEGTGGGGVRGWRGQGGEGQGVEGSGWRGSGGGGVRGGESRRWRGSGVEGVQGAGDRGGGGQGVEWKGIQRCVLKTFQLRGENILPLPSTGLGSGYSDFLTSLLGGEDYSKVI